jgi:hypothetical protein
MPELPHQALMTNILLYGIQVIPRARELLPHGMIPAGSA